MALWLTSPGTCALWGHPCFLAVSTRASRGPSSGTQESAPDQPCLTMQVGRGGGQFHSPPRPSSLQVGVLSGPGLLLGVLPSWSLHSDPAYGSAGWSPTAVFQNGKQGEGRGGVPPWRKLQPWVSALNAPFTLLSRTENLGHQILALPGDNSGFLPFKGCKPQSCPFWGGG